MDDTEDFTITLGGETYDCECYVASRMLFVETPWGGDKTGEPGAKSAIIPTAKMMAHRLAAAAGLPE